MAPGFLLEMIDVEASAALFFLAPVSVAVLFPAALGALDALAEAVGAFPVGSAAPPALGAGQPGRSAWTTSVRNSSLGSIFRGFRSRARTCRSSTYWCGCLCSCRLAACGFRN